MTKLLIDDLSVSYDRPVLSQVNLSVGAGEILGVIGETGSGKTTLARAIVGLAPVTSGRVMFDGVDLTALRAGALRDFRRSGAVQLMFQDPLRALDPQQTVDAIVAEGLRISGNLADHARQVAAALDAVGLGTDVLDRTPAQLSGGQRQRVLLARAIAMKPRLLLADEPVSALDASNRNHVLRLFEQLRDTIGLTIVIISHDLSSLAGIADRVAVLYGGHLVEQGPIQDVLHHPEHPYTALLAAAAPSVRRPRRRPLRAADLRAAPGAAVFTTGCSYASRCPFATDDCAVSPDLIARPGDRTVACHHVDTWPGQIAAKSTSTAALSRR